MKSFHSFTHGGVHQLFHYVDGYMITHRYEKSDIDGLCKGAAMFACMTYVTLLDVVEKANADALAEHLLTMVTPWLFNQKWLEITCGASEVNVFDLEPLGLLLWTDS
mgnify:CR=1 FL=1